MENLTIYSTLHCLISVLSSKVKNKCMLLALRKLIVWTVMPCRVIFWANCSMNAGSC